jgi:hypothetical protein
MILWKIAQFLLRIEIIIPIVQCHLLLVMAGFIVGLLAVILGIVSR